MGEHADDAIFAGLDGSWGWRRSRPFRHRALKKEQRTNQQIFAGYAAPIHGHFKFGDRVVHVPSGTAGVVLATSAKQICWRPDTRLLKGGIWVDADKFRYEGF